MGSHTNTRVVITGVGPVAACGVGRDGFWEALIAGRSGIGPITLFDTKDFDAHLAGEVRDFDLLNFIHPQTPPRRLSRQTQLILAAAKLAMDDSRLSETLNGHRRLVPVCLGVSTSSYNMVEQAAAQLIEKGPGRVSAYSSAASQPHQAASIVAAEFNLDSTAQTLSSACPAGLDAIWTAANLIRSGKADVAITGGGDAPVCALGIACLQQSGLVSRTKHSPGGPFNRGNDSGIISEGAGLLVLEEYHHAMARGAEPYAEIISAASHIDNASEDMFAGLAFAMRHAIADAGLAPSDIDYICAHGSGHPALDRAEVRIIKDLFGAHAYQIPVSSIKGAVGNPLAAAGPLQTIACALALRNGMIPPTANLTEPDPACDLDHVPGRGRRTEVNRILINAHGLGGGNTSLILQRVLQP